MHSAGTGKTAVLEPRRSASSGMKRTRRGATTCPIASRRGLMCITRGPGLSSPVRSFGPARSIRILQSCSSSALAERTLCIMPSQVALSSRAQLMRATFMPAASISLTSAGFSAASLGSVIMMLTSRPGGGTPRMACWCADEAGLRSPSMAGSASASAGGAPARARSACATACSVAMTLRSARPSDDSPSVASSLCSSLISDCRRAT